MGTSGFGAGGGGGHVRGGDGRVLRGGGLGRRRLLQGGQENGQDDGSDEHGFVILLDGDAAAALPVPIWERPALAIEPSVRGQSSPAPSQV